MSNFTLLDCPQASPGKCGVCGYSGNDRKYLSTNLDFEFYGILIFCEECVGAMANDFGFLQPAQSANLERRLTEAESELVTLRAAVLQLEAISDLVAGLTSNRPDVSSDIGDVAVRSDVSESPVLVGSVESKGSDDSIEGLLDFDPDKQDSEQGSDDLSSLTGRGSAEFNL